ncbi:hypothetical protein ABPG72_000814 [Tetrahymena utriculariae]
MQIQEQPLQLVYKNKDGILEVSQQAKNYLCSLKEKSLGILSIVGPYRTGKSCLINKLFINQEQKQFKTSPTVNQCTKGLWICPELFESESGQKFIVIDSEGFGSIEQNENSDNKIIFLNLLLSSVLIFNTMGPIEEKSLNQLYNVLKLVKQLQLQISNDKSVSQDLPFFMWVLRDFSLILEDQNGEPLNSKQYLENSLEEQKGLSETTMQKNMVRKLFKHFFLERDCVAIVRPLEEESQLQSISVQNQTEYRQEFLQDISKLQKKVTKRIKAKVFNNRYITGPQLIFLIEKYLSAINKGVTPNLQKIQESLIEFITQDVEQCDFLTFLFQNNFILTYQIECKNVIFQNLKLKENSELVSQSLQESQLCSTKQKIIELCQLEGINNQNILIEFDKYYQLYKKQNTELYQNKCEEIMAKKINIIQENAIKEDCVILSYWDLINEEIVSQYGEISNIVLETKTKFLQIAYKQFYEYQLQYKQTKHETEIQKHIKCYEDIIKNKEEEKLQLERQINEKDCLLKQQKDFTNDLNEKLKEQLQEYEERQHFYDQQIKLLSTKIDSMKEYQDYARLENELRDVKVEYEFMEQKNQQKREMLIQEIQFLKNEKNQLIEANNHLKTMYAESQERYKEKDCQANQNTNTIVQLQSEIKILNDQLQKTEDKLKETTQTYQNEISSFKLGTEKKMKEIKQSAEELNEVVINKKSEQFERDKQLFESQLLFLKQQLQDSKAINEQLIQALNLGRTQSVSQAEMQFQSYQELMESNKQLLLIINQQENKMQALQSKIDSLKIFKTIVKQSAGFNCKLCNIYCDIDNYQNHLSVCSIGSNPFGDVIRSQIRQNQLNKSFEKSGILSNAAENSNKKKDSSKKWVSRGGSQTRNHSRSQENRDTRLNKSLVLTNSYLKRSCINNQKCNTSVNLANTSQQSIEDCNEITGIHANQVQDQQIYQKYGQHSPLNQIETSHGNFSTKHLIYQRLTQSNIYQTPLASQNQIKKEFQMELISNIQKEVDLRKDEKNNSKHADYIESSLELNNVNDIQEVEEIPFPSLQLEDFSIEILQTLISQDGSSKPYSLYEIQIKLFNEGAQWAVFKKYKDFHELHQRLQTYFTKSSKVPKQDRMKFADVSFVNALSSLNFENSKNDNEGSFMSSQNNSSILEKRAQNIQQYLHMISQVQSIRISAIFQSFFNFSRDQILGNNKLNQVSQESYQESKLQNQSINQKHSHSFSLSIHMDEKNNSINNGNMTNHRGIEESERSLSLSQSPTKKEKSTIRIETLDNGKGMTPYQQHMNTNNLFMANYQRNNVSNIYQIRDQNQLQPQQSESDQNLIYKKYSQLNSTQLGKENISNIVRRDRNQNMGNIQTPQTTSNKISINRQYQVPTSQKFGKQNSKSPNLVKQNGLSYNHSRNLSIDCNNNGLICNEITNYNNLQQNTNKSLKSEIQERIRKSCKVQTAGVLLKKQ